MTTKDEEDKARLELEADRILRESGFDSRGMPIPGPSGEERRRGAAIRLRKPPDYFEEKPE